MKTLLRLTTLSLGLLLLVGCASTQKTTYREAPLEERQTAGSSVVDDRYVAIVESVAKHRGTKVIWVNLPQKRAPRTVAVVE